MGSTYCGVGVLHNLPRPVVVKSRATNVSLREEVWLFRSHLDTSLPMTCLARSRTSLVVDAFQGNGASDASPAVPMSSRMRIKRNDLTLLPLRLAPVEPRAGHDHGRTVAQPQICTRFVGHARYSCWGRPYLHVGACSGGEIVCRTCSGTTQDLRCAPTAERGWARVPHFIQRALRKKAIL